MAAREVGVAGVGLGEHVVAIAEAHERVQRRIDRVDAGERRFRVGFDQQYQQLSATASEDGRTMTVAGARLLGDSVELELSGRAGDQPDRLRLAGRVSGSEMMGTVWTAANTAGTRWRAVRP